MYISINKDNNIYQGNHEKKVKKVKKKKKRNEKENMYISINKYMFILQIRGNYFLFYTRAR